MQPQGDKYEFTGKHWILILFAVIGSLPLLSLWTEFRRFELSGIVTAFVCSAIFFGIAALYYKRNLTIDLQHRFRVEAQQMADTPKRTTPASETETRQARAQLRVARSLVLDAWKDKDDIGNVSYEAAKALSKVRQLDPNAEVVFNHPEFGERPDNHDAIAADIAFLESQMHIREHIEHEKKALEQVLSNPGKGLDKIHSDWALEAARKAVPPIERALKFRPNNVGFLMQAESAYNKAGMTEKAHAAIQRAYELDPDNVNVLKIYNRYT